MAMLPTQSWLRALAGKLTWNLPLPMPNGDRTTPRLTVCKCAAQVAGTWLVGMKLHPCGARHRQRDPREAHRITFTFSFERYGMLQACRKMSPEAAEPLLLMHRMRMRVLVALRARIERSCSCTRPGPERS